MHAYSSLISGYMCRQSQWVSIIFTIMVFTPLLFLRKTGRRETGIRKSTRPFGSCGAF